jgi:hypothetical protein
MVRPLNVLCFKSLFSDKLLAEVPQYNELSVTFIDRSTFWASRFNESIKNKEQIQVVEINYTRLKGGISTPKKWLEEGYPYSL